MMLWLDLEMTGLDVEKEVIIEAAAIITDYDFTEYASYHAVIKQPQEYIDRMDDWNRTHHGASGLIDQIPNGKPEHQVELELLELVNHHFAQHERPVLCGNSIAQDRTFIKKYWREMEARLHYRMLDVTAWKVVFQNRFSETYAKRESHRALDDIRESIEELRHYVNHIELPVQLATTPPPRL